MIIHKVPDIISFMLLQFKEEHLRRRYVRDHSINSYALYKLYKYQKYTVMSYGI